MTSHSNPQTGAQPILELRHGVKRFGSQIALSDVSFQLHSGARLAIVGESGSGKTTLLRSLLGLAALDSGELLFQGEAYSSRRSRTLRALRSRSAVIFQDPANSFNPLLPLKVSMLEPFKAAGLPRAAGLLRLTELLQQMQLPADSLTRYPHEFSGGGKQRLALVRALATEPLVLFADEPVSALDAVLRQQFVTLLRQATTQRPQLATLVVTHDLTVVPQLADEVVVMQRGEIVERGSVSAVFAAPQHPYTQQLLAARASLAPANGSR